MTKQSHKGSKKISSAESFYDRVSGKIFSKFTIVQSDNTVAK